MSDIILDWDRGRRQGIIKGEYASDLREIISVPDETARFRRYRNRFSPARKYVITPAGRFDPGLGAEIIKQAQSNFSNASIEITDALKEQLMPTFEDKDLSSLRLELRDYQEDAVKGCLSKGRGVINLATAGGKTLIIASLLETIHKQHIDNLQALVIVPDLGLVNQTYDDFNDYSVSFTHTKWTGNNTPVLGSNVIIANLGILQSKNTDTSFLEHFDVVIVDEVHKLRRGNKVNKLINKIHTPHKFGFTGTLPEDQVDQWNILGKIGPVLLTKTSKALSEEKYVTPAKVIMLQMHYNSQPEAPTDPSQVAAAYRKEMEFIMRNKFRNETIAKLSETVPNNMLIIIDYIEHGELLEEIISQQCDKKVYFIRGEVDVEERDRVKKIMEDNKDVICIAISKIFSTGINIKNLHYIMFASGGKAKIKIVQSIGRGLRLHTDKKEVIIFDIGDSLRYGLRHMDKRLTLYRKEQFSYGIREIREQA